MKTFESRFHVRSYELDAFGHVNHAVFLNYLEQARFEALAAGGFPLSVLAAAGWGIHVVRVEVDYRRELRLGDALAVSTWMEEWRNSSMVIGQELRVVEGDGDPGPLAAQARVTAVWIGPDRRPMRIPQEARDALG